jgi:hypothetical protein
MTAIDSSEFVTIAILQICDGRELFPLVALLSPVCKTEINGRGDSLS